MVLRMGAHLDCGTRLIGEPHQWRDKHLHSNETILSKHGGVELLFHNQGLSRKQIDILLHVLQRHDTIC